MKRFLPYAIAYIIYASIVLIAIADERGHHFWEPFLGWLITIPLIIGSIIYVFWKYYKKVRPNSKQEPIFIENWSLMDFAREYGPRMQIGKFTNKNTGKEYQACVFIQRDGTQTYVNFFSQLGELSSAEISIRKNELKVGLTASNKLYLHDGNVEMWEDVNLNM